MNEKISTFLFDLGSVVVDVRVQKTVDALTKLFKPSQKSVLDIIGGEPLSGGFVSKVFNDYQIGAISTHRFIAFIKDFCLEDVTDEMIIDAWMQMLISIPDDVIKTFQRIKDKGLKIFILSNINELHVEWLKINAPILNLATNRFYSNEIHLAKPDKECYEYVLNHSDIIPQHTIYLDDLQQNIDAGRHFGFHTLLVENFSWVGMINNLLDVQ